MQLPADGDRSRLLVFAILALALVVARAIGSGPIFVYDDAFITFRYAINLVETGAMVYNPGEWVLGTTTPAFAVLTAGLYAIGLPLPGAVQGLNVLVEVAILAVTVLIVLRHVHVLASIAFGLLLAASPIMARVSLGGMESAMFLLASLGALVLYHRDRPYPAVLLASFAYFLRPEGVLLVLVLLASELLARRPGRAVLLGLVSLATVAPFLALIHATYGSIFSQSVIAKTVLPTPPPLQVVEKFLFPEPLMALAVIVAAFGAVHAWRDGGLTRLVMIWVGLYFLAYLIARPFVWSWYGEPIFYLAILLAARAVPPLLERLPLRRALPRTVPLAVAAGLLAVMGWTAVRAYRSPAAVEALVQQPLAAWCAENVTPSTTFCAYDIGALGFYSRAYITDLAGLVTRGVVERTMGEVIREARPDYVFVVADRVNIRVLNEPGLRGLYTPIRRFSAVGATELTLDTNRYASGWSHDYIILRRN